MAINSTKWEKAKILNHVFGGTVYTPVTNWYLGFSKTAITEDGAGITEPTELSGYQRYEITNDKTEWSVAVTTTTTASVVNLNSLSFPQIDQAIPNVYSIFLATGSGVYTGTTPAPTSGCVAYYYNITPTAFSVSPATIVNFDSGKISITFS